MRKLILAGLATWFLTGSALAEGWNPKEPINGFSRDSFFRSIKALSRLLSEDERVIFRRGLNALILSDFPLTHGMTAQEAAPFLPMALDAAHVTLDGTSLGAVMAAGERQPSDPGPSSQNAGSSVDRNKEPNPFERIAALDAEAEKRQEQLEQHLIAVRHCLSDKIPLAVHFVRKEGLYDDLELTLTNGLRWPIGSLAFSYVITTEGRRLPFTQKEMSRTLRGGLKPGEQRTVRITVSSVPVDLAPASLAIAVDILNVGDMEGKSLLNHPKSLFTGGLTDQTCE